MIDGNKQFADKLTQFLESHVHLGSSVIRANCLLAAAMGIVDNIAIQASRHSMSREEWLLYCGRFYDLLEPPCANTTPNAESE